MVQVMRAGKADETTLDNLLQLYLHDFSEFDGSQMSSDGRLEIIDDGRRKWIVFRFEYVLSEGENNFE